MLAKHAPAEESKQTKNVAVWCKTQKDSLMLQLYIKQVWSAHDRWSGILLHINRRQRRDERRGQDETLKGRKTKEVIKNDWSERAARNKVGGKTRRRRRRARRPVSCSRWTFSMTFPSTSSIRPPFNPPPQWQHSPRASSCLSVCYSLTFCFGSFAAWLSKSSAHQRWGGGVKALAPADRGGVYTPHSDKSITLLKQWRLNPLREHFLLLRAAKRWANLSTIRPCSPRGGQNKNRDCCSF